MTSPASGPDRHRTAGDRRVRRGRVSALVLGTIVASTVALVAMVGWPSLWWDIATNVKPPSPLPGRRGFRPQPQPPPPSPVIPSPDWRSEPSDKPDRKSVVSGKGATQGVRRVP